MVWVKINASVQLQNVYEVSWMEFLCLIHLTTPSTPSMLTFLPLSNTKLQGGPLESYLQRYSLKFGPFDRATIFDVLVRGERVAHGHKPTYNYRPTS